MSIYIEATPNIKIEGLTKALVQDEVMCFFWDTNSHSLFEMIDLKNPSVVFLRSSEDAGKKAEYAKHEFPHIKMVLMKEQTIPGMKHFDIVLDLVSDHVEGGHFRLPYLTDFITYGDGKFQDHLACELLIINDFIEYNNDVDKLIRSLGYNFRLKVIGNNDWNNPYYVGKVPVENYRHFMASTDVLIEFGPEWTMNAAINGAYPMKNNEIPEKIELTLDNLETGRLEHLQDSAQKFSYKGAARELRKELQI